MKRDWRIFAGGVLGRLSTHGRLFNKEGPLKRLLLAVTALGLAGTIGTANAAPVGGAGTGTTVNSLAIWNALTPGDPLGIGNSQKALPAAFPIFGNPIMNPGALVASGAVTGGQINFNLASGTATIGNFLSTSPGTWPGAGSLVTISQGGFAQASLFEFKFTTTSAGSLSIVNDDGVSLFVDGNTTTDLLPLLAANPTNQTNNGPVNLAGGTTYDLFYSEVNGLPAVLQTTFNAVPTPLIGHGLLVLLAVGGVLFGGKFLESHKKHAA
jgi:hypothetical protein